MDKRKIYLDKIIRIMNNDFPLLKNLKIYGFYDQLSNDEMDYVLSGIFGQPVKVEGYGYGIYDENGELIYWEEHDGFWEKSEYDKYGNRIYSEDSDGYWEKREYDEDGNIIYFEDSDGIWIR
jgi:hypothetical protein